MKQLTLLEALQRPDVKFRLNEKQACFIHALKGTANFCCFGFSTNNEGCLFVSKNKEIYDNVNAEIVEIVEIDYDASNIIYKKKEREGWCVIEDCVVFRTESTAGKRLLWETKEQCLASAAMAELSFLMAEANEGWVADEGTATMSKATAGITVTEGAVRHGICSHGIDLMVGSIWLSKRFLTFKTEEIAEKFLVDNRELIEKAKVLL